MSTIYLIVRDLRKGYSVQAEERRDGVLIGTANGVEIRHVRTLTKAKAKDVLVAVLPVIVSLLDIPASSVTYAGSSSPVQRRAKKKSDKQMRLFD